MIKCDFPLVFLIAILHIAIYHAYDFELPKTVHPIEYDLTITPNLTNGSYTGTVVIMANVTIDINSITMHSKKLEIIDARVDFEKVKVTTNIPYDFLILTKIKKIKKGIHRIIIDFEGDMKNKSYGFFRGYEEEYGQKIYFGATFFEPINARTAFPCFDEPIYKAKFLIHVAKPPEYTALSNMNQVGETQAPNGYSYAHFAKTPSMSSYLVSFFVGNYTYVEDFYVAKDNRVVPTRMYSPLAKIKYVHFAVKQMPKQLKWFVNYTGFDFMLPKLGTVIVIES